MKTQIETVNFHAACGAAVLAGRSLEPARDVRELGLRGACVEIGPDGARDGLSDHWSARLARAWRAAQ